MAMMTRVNRILLRRSATLNMFRMLDSTMVPLWLPPAARAGVLRGDASTPVLPPGRARTQSGVPAGRLPGDQRLANWFPLAGGRRSPHGSGSTSTLPPAAAMARSAVLEKAWAFTVTDRQLAPPEDLDQGTLG